jgi:hypothetical protein
VVIVRTTYMRWHHHHQQSETIEISLLAGDVYHRGD